ncbi:lysozyme family protein [Alkalihalobacillus sp. TS-13]|uniref:lysozyme family protein n=1 Tax=Alkalihalobacillus sp. TS-13 TaxID=2842455 RepID=UPI001C884B54|nr:lysozyme family protein [Alkalihalobacillus sp. TS-13]
MLKQYAEAKAKKALLILMLKYILPILLLFALIYGIIFLLVLMLGNLSSQESENLTNGQVGNVSQEVMQYKDEVTKYAKQEGVEDYVGIILALMMQESGGRGLDPMQASESHCESMGCIVNPEVSIQQGVKYFAQTLNRSNQDVKLALQSYNFGTGFIDYVMQHGGKYTQELAIDFSSMKYEQLKHQGIYSCVRPEALQYNACYGDIYYVDAVLQYYNFETPIGDGEWAVPVAGAVNITSPYGWRTWGDGSRENHKGVDFSCIEGVTPIQAVEKGRVIYSGFQVNRDGSDGYGNLVMIQHGNLISAYGHLSKLDVREGDTVKKGQQIGVCGSTGESTGPHLHLEAKTSEWSGHQNPAALLGL